MSTKKIIRQVRVDGGRIKTEYEDGSIEFSAPNFQDTSKPLSSDEQIKRAGERMFEKVETDKGTGVRIPSDFGNAVNKNLDELERLRAENEQMKKDEMAIKLQPDGGGKIKLPTERQNRRFNSPIQMVNDLYDRHEAGDKNASNSLDALWELSKEPILEMERRGFSMSACISCGNAMIQGEGKVCKFCGYSYIDSPEKSGFVLFT